MVRFPEINEASGLVLSRKNPGVLWVHNDSGDGPRLFALNSRGGHLGTYRVQGAQSVDWEDMALGPCPGGGQCLFIGDIGDNLRKRKNITVYRVPEPRVDAAINGRWQVLTGLSRFDLVYPDRPHNAESLIVHPESGVIYIITKTASGLSGVYKYPNLLKPKPMDKLIRVARLDFSKARIRGGRLATGADLLFSAKRLVVRTYLRAWEYRLIGSAPFEQIFLSKPRPISLALEIQGESIAYGPHGEAIYTLSEGRNQPLWRLACEP